jgi:hypothetical protein
MIIKHEKLLKMIDTKSSGKWKPIDELSQRKFSDQEKAILPDIPLRKLSSQADS